MKSKTFFITTMLLSILTASFAQTTTLGIRGGINFSNWNVSGAAVETLSYTGFDGGGFAVFNISRSFSLEPGISLATYGATLKYTDIEKVKSKIAYVQLPFYVRYKLANGISFFTGPQLAFVAKATINVKDEPAKDAKNLFKKKDLFIAGGLEYIFPAGVSIAAKYTTGLVNIYEMDDQKIKNYSFGISLAYQFALAKRK